MRTRTILAVLTAAVALVAVACGSGTKDAAGGPTRTIEIEMRDIAFSPDQITVPAGQAVRLVFHNGGKVDHDAFIGDDMAQRDHEQEMRSAMGGMQHGGGGEAITVKPGKTETMTHTFRAGDDVLIGCHQSGHYAAGMKIRVVSA